MFHIYHAEKINIIHICIYNTYVFACVCDHHVSSESDQTPSGQRPAVWFWCSSQSNHWFCFEGNQFTQLIVKDPMNVLNSFFPFKPIPPKMNNLLKYHFFPPSSKLSIKSCILGTAMLAQHAWAAWAPSFPSTMIECFQAPVHIQGLFKSLKRLLTSNAATVGWR